MLATLTTVNAGDFKQRYQGVFGYLLVESKRTLVYIHQVSGTKVTFRDKDGTEYFAMANAPVTFEFQPVMRGMVNTPEGVHLLVRVPARQYKRGICTENTRAYTMNNNGTWRMATFDFNEVVFNVLSSTISYKEAADLWFNKKIKAVALSPRFGITPRNEVLFHDIVIGTVTDDTILLKKTIVFQELSDLINRNNYPLKVHY
jgi:hypothetical protein